jgi:hypothetical protein
VKRLTTRLKDVEEQKRTIEKQQRQQQSKQRQNTISSFVKPAGVPTVGEHIRPHSVPDNIGKGYNQVEMKRTLRRHVSKVEGDILAAQTANKVIA